MKRDTGDGLVQEMKRDTGDGPATNLAVLVLTAKREEDYLRRTLATLSRELAGLRTTERPRVFVCSADDRPELEVAGAAAGDVTVLLPCREPGRCPGRLHLAGGAREAKVVHDLAVCHAALEDRLDAGVSTILGLEDDVLLMPSFFPTLASILALHASRLARQPWLDVKLYLTPRLRGKYRLTSGDPNPDCLAVARLRQGPAASVRPPGDGRPRQPLAGGCPPLAPG